MTDQNRDRGAEKLLGNIHNNQKVANSRPLKPVMTNQTEQILRRKIQKLDRYIDGRVLISEDYLVQLIAEAHKPSDKTLSELIEQAQTFVATNGAQGMPRDDVVAIIEAHKGYEPVKACNCLCSDCHAGRHHKPCSLSDAKLYTANELAQAVEEARHKEAQLYLDNLRALKLIDDEDPDYMVIVGEAEKRVAFWKGKMAPPHNPTHAKKPCNGAHCKCMGNGCPNNHAFDHVCPYKPAQSQKDNN